MYIIRFIVWRTRITWHAAQSSSILYASFLNWRCLQRGHGTYTCVFGGDTFAFWTFELSNKKPETIPTPKQLKADTNCNQWTWRNHIKIWKKQSIRIIGSTFIVRNVYRQCNCVYNLATSIDKTIARSILVAVWVPNLNSFLKFQIQIQMCKETERCWGCSFVNQTGRSFIRSIALRRVAQPPSMQLIPKSTYYTQPKKCHKTTQTTAPLTKKIRRALLNLSRPPTLATYICTPQIRAVTQFRTGLRLTAIKHIWLSD